MSNTVTSFNCRSYKYTMSKPDLDWDLLIGENELEIGVKNQKSKDELKKYVISESLTDDKRAVELLKRGLPLQRLSVAKNINHYLQGPASIETLKILLPHIRVRPATFVFCN